MSISMPHMGMHSATAAENVGIGDLVNLAAGTLEIMTTVADAADDPTMLGGILAACLVGVLSWFAASILRLRRTVVTVVCPIRAGPTYAASTALPRAPTLAQLCVLRT